MGMEITNQEEIMSAYIVTREHIAYLVKAAESRRLNPSHAHLSWFWNINHEEGTYERSDLKSSDNAQATRVGQMLWDENIKSVHARYPKDSLSSLPGTIGENYQFSYNPRIKTEIDSVQVLKAADCYEYHSCEHPDWQASEAKAFIDALRSAAWHSLVGYSDAKWEITS
jgi:hypothetical protein